MHIELRAPRCSWFGAFALLLALAAAACSGLRPAMLRVASSGDYPPFSIAVDSGVLVGFDTAVAERFARDTGRSLNFVPLRWPSLIDDARGGSFDVAMSGVTLRAERLPYLRFTRPYAVTGAVVVVRRDRAEHLASLAALDRPDMRLAVNRGGHLERVSRKHFPQAELVAVDDNTKLPDLILAGAVDAAISEQYEAANWQRMGLVMSAPFTRDRKAYAVPAQREELADEIDHWLAARETDGWLNGERRRWLGERSLWTPEQACFEAIAAAIDMRLQLMRWIARAKHLRQQPIEDPEQEARVIATVRRQARELGLEIEAAVLLFGDLIQAAKVVQRTAIPTASAEESDADLSLLRAAVQAQSWQILQEAARCRPALQRVETRPLLEATLDEGIQGLSTTGATAERLASGLSRL